MLRYADWPAGGSTDLTTTSRTQIDLNNRARCFWLPMSRNVLPKALKNTLQWRNVHTLWLSSKEINTMFPVSVVTEHWNWFKKSFNQMLEWQFAPPLKKDNMNINATWAPYLSQVTLWTQRVTLPPFLLSDFALPLTCMLLPRCRPPFCNHFLPNTTHAHKQVFKGWACPQGHPTFYASGKYPVCSPSLTGKHYSD